MPLKFTILGQGLQSTGEKKTLLHFFSYFLFSRVSDEPGGSLYSVMERFKVPVAPFSLKGGNSICVLVPDRMYSLII